MPQLTEQENFAVELAIDVLLDLDASLTDRADAARALARDFGVFLRRCDECHPERVAAAYFDGEGGALCNSHWLSLPEGEYEGWDPV